MLRTSQLAPQKNGDAAQQFEALGDYVLIEWIDKDTTPGGLVLPENAQVDELPMGRVVSVGPGMHTNTGALIPVSLKRGDVVYLVIHGRTGDIMLNGKKYTVCREMQIVGKVRQE